MSAVGARVAADDPVGAGEQLAATCLETKLIRDSRMRTCDGKGLKCHACKHKQNLDKSSVCSVCVCVGVKVFLLCNSNRKPKHFAERRGGVT